ncbi:SMI1/KNR4 family protein OS=Lysinibacillus sphaericus OX=1421 GN=LS41612_13385 PE=4 SV=1 [Lysinibacillus sphaericus]
MRLKSILIFNYIPSRLIEFWKSYNEVSFENGINIYGFDIAIERNGLYEVSTYAPEYILIGDDGGGQGLFLKKNSDLNVFYQDFGALSLPFYTLDTDLFRWLENDAVIKDDDFTFDEPDLIEEVKVYIVRKPNEANKFIMELRKCFNLNLSINDIKRKTE